MPEEPTIFAIGGGDMGGLETLAIDRKIVESTGKAQPNALFIPAASGDADDYIACFQKVYGSELGCHTDVLRVASRIPEVGEVESLISWADLVYVGGGNTRRMLALWEEYRVSSWLLDAWQHGTVMSGLSAGANCWFRYANSDSPMLDGEPYGTTIRLDCLGWLPYATCPHMLAEDYRLQAMREMMLTTPGVGIGIDDWAAVQFVGDQFRVLASRQGSGATLFWVENERAMERRLNAGSLLLSTDLLKSP